MRAGIDQDGGKPTWVKKRMDRRVRVIPDMVRRRDPCRAGTHDLA